MLTTYKAYRNNLINQKAECLYNQIGKEPGFDIEKAVNALGGKLILDEHRQLPLGVDAKIDIKEDGSLAFNIIYARDKSEMFTRFSVAHELGHLFLHMLERDAEGNVVVVRSSCNRDMRNYNIREWEAEEFAAAFLMPEEELRSYIEKLQGDVERIARVFKVSSQSVIVRCKRLGIL